MFFKIRRKDAGHRHCLPWRLARHLSPEQLRDIGLEACPGTTPVFLRHLW